MLRVIINCTDLYSYGLVINRNNNTLCETSPRKLTDGYAIRFSGIAPLVVIILLYSRTIKILRQKDKVLSHSEAPRAVKNKQRAIKTSFSVVIIIVVCFLPWYVVLLLMDSLACSLSLEN